MKTIALALLLLSTFAHASDFEYSLNINGISKHLNSDVSYNENNPGLGITAESEGQFLTAGGYKNSFNRPSYYIGGGIKKRYGRKHFYIEPGILSGIITGYENKYTFMVLPMITAGFHKFGAVNLMYAPKTEENPATLMLNYSIPLNE